MWSGPLAVGALARAGYWIFVTPGWTPRSDADHYLRLARSVASGTGFSLAFPQLEMHATAFRPPLYPLLLAIVEWVGGTDVLWPARLLSVVLGLAVIALTVKLGARLAGPTAGVVAGGLVAVYPPLVANDTITLSEPLALLLILGILLTLHDRRWIACGVLSGLLLLTRPNAYLVVVVVVAALWRLVGRRPALLYALVCTALVVPWLVRNQIQVGTVRPTTSDGFTLAAIYAPPARERETFVNPVYDHWYDGSEFEILQFDEARWSAALSRLAYDSIRDDPGYVVAVVRQNTRAYFEIDTAANESAERYDGRNIDFRMATLPLYYVVTALGLAGVVLNIRRRETWPALAIAAQFTALSLLIVAPPRLRAPFDLTMCIGIGLLSRVDHTTARIPVPHRHDPSRTRSRACAGASPDTLTRPPTPESGLRLTGERPMQGATPDSLLALHDAGYREVVARLGSGVVLDAGCGVGDETARLRGEDRFVLGVDYSASTAVAADREWGERAGSEGGIGFAGMDGSRLGIRTRSVDWACSSHLIEHFTNPERHAAELARVLAPDGTAFVITPNAPADFENPFHVYLFDPAQLASLLRIFFDEVEVLGLEGSADIRADFASRRASGERLLKLDVLRLRHRLPRRWYVWGYQHALPVVYRVLGREGAGIGSGLDHTHFTVTDDIDVATPVLFAIARRPRRSVRDGA